MLPHTTQNFAACLTFAGAESGSADNTTLSGVLGTSEGWDVMGGGNGQAPEVDPWQPHEFQQGQVQGPSDRTSDNGLKLEESRLD